MKPIDIRNKVVRKWNVEVSNNTIRRAKALVAKNIDGSWKEQFKRIYDYAHEIIRSNPGSTAKVKVEENNGEPTFIRLYIYLKACKDSFNSCRPIIGLDGCFLKGKYGSELLVAIGIDANDQIMPIAWVVVEVENKETWTWFMDLLIDDLGGPQILGLCTFISD